MKISSIHPHDASDKLSFAYAMGRGYQATLDEDGCAEVVNPDGQAYHIHQFECDCPDAQGRDGGSYELPDGRRICKHVALIGQIYPCQCGSAMHS